MRHRVADLHQAACVQHRHPRGEAGAGRRAVEPTRRDDDRVPGHRSDALPRLRDLHDRHAGDRRVLRVQTRQAARARPRGSAHRRATARAPRAARSRIRAPTRRRSRTTCLRTRRRRRAFRARRPRAAHRGARRTTAHSSARRSRRGRRGTPPAPRRRPPGASSRSTVSGSVISTKPDFEQHGRDADRVRARHRRILGRLHDDVAPLAVRPRVDGTSRLAWVATEPRGSRSRKRRSESSAASVCICSKTVAPAGGATPATTTFPTSPPAWQPMTVIARRARIAGRPYRLAPQLPLVG